MTDYKILLGNGKLIVGKNFTYNEDDIFIGIEKISQACESDNHVYKVNSIYESGRVKESYKTEKQYKKLKNIAWKNRTKIWFKDKFCCLR